MSSSIERELVRCRQSAEEGYNLANAKYSDIKNTLIDASKSLSKTDAEQSKVKRIQNTELVENQKKGASTAQKSNRLYRLGLAKPARTYERFFYRSLRADNGGQININGNFDAWQRKINRQRLATHNA